MKSSSAVLITFASELLLFLAAASAVALVALRGALFSHLRSGRVALGLGYAALAVAAFLHGGRLAGDESGIVAGLRLGGAAALLTACARGWAGGAGARLFLLSSMTFLTVATIPYGSDLASWICLSAGAVLLGAAVIASSRRTITARVVAGAASTLLLVILVLGLALSVMLAGTVEDAAVERLRRRATDEATNAARQSLPRILEATAVGVKLQASFPKEVARGDPSPRNFSQLLQEASSELVLDVGVGYLDGSGAVLGVLNISHDEMADLAVRTVVRQALDEKDPRGSVERGIGRTLVVGAHPIVGSDTTVMGATVAVLVLDGSYLARVSSDDPDLSLALFDPTGIVARHGRQPPPRALAGMVGAALQGRSSTGPLSGSFVSVVPVRAEDGTVQAALVASTPTALVDRARNELFRNLFVVALAGALLALASAAVVGARIGGGLRRLRRAAEGIEGGDLEARAGIDSDDEVGVVGRTFDAMAASVQDKTEAEKRLRGRLEAVVAGMGEALVAIDGAGRITDFNRAAERLLDVPPPEALGAPVDGVIKLASLDDATSLVRLSGTAGGWSAPGEIERPDGGRTPVAVSVGSMGGPGTGAGDRVVVLADLTGEREVEQMKTEFLSRVGHELRHPLVPVMGYSELLQRKQLDPAVVQDMASVIHTEARKLLRIMELLEFFAASGARRMVLRVDVVEPRTMVEEVVARWQRTAQAPIVVRGRVRRGTPVTVADRERLRRCLDELLDNAVKFSPAGGTVTVTAAPADGGLTITVSDQGIGMSPADVAAAFEEFHQADPGDTRAYGGLGLGLAYVRRVVEAHGGTLSCTSVLAKGSRLSLFLPDEPAVGRREPR